MVKSNGSKNHRSHKSNYDLSADLGKIKKALVEASLDVKGRAGEILSDSTENMKNKSDDLQNNITKYITKKPFKSISIAIVSGLVIGFLFRR